MSRKANEIDERGIRGGKIVCVFCLLANWFASHTSHYNGMTHEFAPNAFRPMVYDEPSQADRLR